MPPNSALTRFLRQGLSRGVCPLCRVAYKMDGEYMWAFFDEYSSDQGTLDRLRRARGFCSEHAERLRRLEVEGLRSNLGISVVYLDTLEGLSEELASIGPNDGFPSGQACPACAYRDEEVEKNARYLLEEITGDPNSRERFLSSSGLCFPHFQLAWERARDESEHQLLLDLQRRAVVELIEDLRENIRKQGHDYEGGPSAEESESWRRAIYLTAGWAKDALRDERPERKNQYVLPEFARVRPDGEGSEGEAPAEIDASRACFRHGA